MIWLIPKRVKKDKKSCKNIIIYYSWYITIKNRSYVNINSINPLCLIIDKVDGYIEESNGNRYVTLVSTDRNKVTLKNIENYGIKLKV